ncbi:MAG: branched-chain amino acid ABC transporter permease [Dehalococcoidia bacterium]|nr:branched-chain amino acid ABC transporter permease [Dehalococcoidia bacterium]
MLALVRRRPKQLAIAALIVVLAIVPFLGNAYYTSVLIIIGINAMVAVGLCLLMGYTGQVSLGHAAFYGLGAYISAVLSRTYHVNPWLAMLAAVVATTAFAFAVGFPIFRLRGNYLAMATLGLGIILWILFREVDSITGGPSGLSGVPYLSIAGFNFSSDFRFYYLVWGFCIAIMVISESIVASRMGRAMRAVHGSESAAQSLGVNAAVVKVKVLALSAAYAAVAGSLFTYYLTFVSPQPFDFLFSVQLVVMAVVGGLASIWGAVFGAGAIRVLSEVLHPFGELDVVVFGLLLMVVMILTPQGLVRGIADLWHRFVSVRLAPTR